MKAGGKQYFMAPARGVRKENVPVLISMIVTHITEILLQCLRKCPNFSFLNNVVEINGLGTMRSR